VAVGRVHAFAINSAREQFVDHLIADPRIGRPESSPGPPESVPIHVIARRLGHASIETTNRYLAEVADNIGAVGEVLDRRHQSWRRERLA
jgi:integrase